MAPNRPPRPPAALAEWLRTADIEDVRAAFPAEWSSAQQQVAEVIASGNLAALADYSARVAAPARPRRASGRYAQEQATREAIEQRLVADALQQARMVLATGQLEGRVKFNRINGLRLQRLLFESGLRRKPVSLRKFERTWPRISQRRLLMPLVMPKGIYCFYSEELVAGLVELIGPRSCVEIAAGDGTLSRFLNQAGTPITATDDHSWSKTIEFGPDVVRVDASTALRRYQPEVVICSWPPAGNRFEREVFRAASVDTYVVITTTLEQSAGNWDDYRRQQRFDMRVDDELSRGVLPPEQHPTALVFERRHDRGNR